VLASITAGLLLGAAPPAGAVRFRAMGDSVTAGFGYCGTGDSACGGSQDQLMSPFRLLGCVTGPLDDRCSSNFGNPTMAGSNVSWAVQFAHRVGISDVRNTAVQGSTPADWDSGGALHGSLTQLIASKPDLMAMTLGANPVLAEFSRGAGLVCTLFTDETTLKICVRAFLARIHSVKHLVAVYHAILTQTNARVVVFSYHNPVPNVAAAVGLRHKVEVILHEINRAVGTAVEEARREFGERIQLIAPDHSPWGLDHQCAAVQALTITEWFLTFGRSGLNPRDSSTPWVLDNDACTHPTQAGHTQFANSLARLYPNLGLARDAGRSPRFIGQELPLLSIDYPAVQISSGHPEMNITLRSASQVTIGIANDPCLRHATCFPAHGARSPGFIDQRLHETAGSHLVHLQTGDGLFSVTVSARPDDGGPTETETVDLVDETRGGLMRIFGSKAPR
jgi:lysophospholipase L1-like esterase